MQLDGLRHLVLVDAKAPVSFFAYPDKASYLVPDGCEVHVLAGPEDDAAAALDAMADILGIAAGEGSSAPAGRPDRPTGALTADSVAQAARRASAGGGDRLGRGEHVRPVHERPHRGRASARLAVPHRRRHRSGAAARARRRGRRSRPAGDRARGRRQRALHDPVVVDHGPRGTRRDRRPLQQPGLFDPQHGARPSGRRPAGSEGEVDAGPVESRRSTSCASRKVSGVPAVRTDDAETFSAELEKALSEPGPHLVEAIVPEIF